MSVHTTVSDIVRFLRLLSDDLRDGAESGDATLADLQDKLEDLADSVDTMLDKLDGGHTPIG